MTQAFVNAPMRRGRPPSAGVRTDDGEETLGWREAGSARQRAGRRPSPASLQIRDGSHQEEENGEAEFM